MSGFDCSSEISYNESTGEYYVSLPSDLMDELNWLEGNVVEWEYHDYNLEPGLRLHRVGE
jgi:hypothetical protein